jgi:hypothetical protein
LIRIADGTPKRHIPVERGMRRACPAWLGRLAPI